MKRRKFIAALVGAPAFLKAAGRLRAAPPRVIEMKLVSAPVVAQARKLKAMWTCELEQDLNAMYNIEVEDILKKALDGHFASVVKPE